MALTLCWISVHKCYALQNVVNGLKDGVMLIQQHITDITELLPHKIL
jgi:hypothetical protein